MQRGFETSFDLQNGQRLTLRDPDWLKRPEALAWMWSSSLQFLRSVVRVADKVRVLPELLALWLARSLVVWPAVKTFMMIRPEEGSHRTARGDVFSDRGYSSIDAGYAAARDPRAFEREKKDLLFAVPSSPNHGNRQDLVTPSKSLTKRESLMVWAAASIIEEVGAPNLVKIRAHCREEQFPGVLLAATGGQQHRWTECPSTTKSSWTGRKERRGREESGRSADRQEGDTEVDGSVASDRVVENKTGKKATTTRETTGKRAIAATSTWASTSSDADSGYEKPPVNRGGEDQASKTPTDALAAAAGLSAADAWRCLFARAVDAVFFKACLEERFLLVPVDASEFELFLDLFCDKDGIVVVAEDNGDVRLLSELDAETSSTFLFPSRVPSGDWGGRREPCREKISVGFELQIGELPTTATDGAAADRQNFERDGDGVRYPDGERGKRKDDEKDRLFEKQVMMDQE